jgi:hypothetical protein
MHFLTKKELDSEARRMSGGRRVAATIEAVRRGKDRILVICGPDDVEHPVFMPKIGSAMIRLPETIKIESPDGSVCKPTWAFWVSLETIDPFHFVIDSEEP